MTGEITLRGLVLKVGGIKEKVLGAHRAGIHTVILPADNQSDVEEVPIEARSRMIFAPVERAEQVIQLALEAEPVDAAGNGGGGPEQEGLPRATPEREQEPASTGRLAARPGAKK
jgi:ATP-dependent Lon protease